MTNYFAMNRWVLSFILCWPGLMLASECENEGRYVIDRNLGTVIYQSTADSGDDNFDRSIPWVNLPTFKVIEHDGCLTPYAKDIDRVYYKAQVVEAVHPDYFEASTTLSGLWIEREKWIKEGEVLQSELVDIGDGYFQLAGNTYYQGQVLSEEIVQVKKGFGIGAQTIFKEGMVTDFDPNTFRAFDHYALDAQKLRYYMGEQVLLIENADAQSFTPFKDQTLLAADHNQYYFEGRVIASPGEYLEYFSHGFFRDENQVYFYGTPMPEFDADTFKVHFKAGKYLQDKNGAYYVTKMSFSSAIFEYEHLPSTVDYDSFKVLRYNVAQDENNIYEASELADFTLESLGGTEENDYESGPSLKIEKPEKVKIETPKVKRPEPQVQKIPRVNSGISSGNSEAFIIDPLGEALKNEGTILDRVVSKPQLKITWWQRFLNWLLW